MAAPIIQKIILDLASAENQLNALQARVEQPVDVPIRLDGAAKLEAARESLGLMADDARAVGSATEGLDDQFRLISQSLGVSESDARDLAQSIGTAEIRSSQLDDELKSVARAMGLSDTEAAKFSREMRKAEGATDKAADEARRLAKETDKVGAGGNIGKLRGQLLGLAAAFGVGVGVQGVISGFRNAIDSATALGESVNAVNVVFKDGAPAILAFGENAARSVGLANSELNQLVTPIGALLGNFNIDGQAAADVTLELTQRAADLASVFNTEVPDALAAIGSALRGEQEPIRAYGVSLDEAAVSQKALALGLADTAGELTAAEKGQARLQLILEQSAFAAGDFANTSGEAAGQTKILKAEAEEASAALGEQLMPAYEAILEVIPPLLDGLGQLAPAFTSLATSIAGAADAAVESGFLAFLTDLPRGFAAISDVGGGAAGVIKGFAGVFTNLGDPEEFARAVREGGDALEGIANNLQIRVGEQSLIGDLREGVDPALALANALAFLDRQGELTDETLKRFSGISGVSTGSAEFINLLTFLKDSGELSAAGVDALTESIKAYQDVFFQRGGLNSADAALFNVANIPETITLFDRLAESLGEVFDPSQAQDSLAARFGTLPVVVDNVRDLRRALDIAGISMEDFLSGDQGDIVAVLDDAESAGLRLAEAMRALSAIDPVAGFVGAADIVDAETGEIITDLDKLKEALLEQATAQAEFDANLAEIFRTSGAAVAQLVADSGPDAALLAQALVGDPAMGREIAAVLAGNIGEASGPISETLAETIAAATPAQLEAISAFAANNFLSPGIIQQILQTGSAISGLIEDGMAGTAIAPALLIELTNAQVVGVLQTGQIPVHGGFFDTPGTGTASTGGPGPAGGRAEAVVVNNTVNINNADTKDVDTSASQAAQTIDAVSRNLWRGAN